MSEPLNDSSPPPKKRGRCCLSCGLIFLGTLALLAGAYFLGPKIGQWLGIFGMDAREAYEAAPDLAGSQSLTDTFEELGIPGVTVYVIPIKGTSTQGAFIIFDVSSGYEGMDPLNAKDDILLLVLREITLRNRLENLRLAHVTVEYRDENGDPATAFTVDQDHVEEFAKGQITQEEFFASIDFDLLGTLDYLGIDGLLEEIQE